MSFSDYTRLTKKSLGFLLPYLGTLLRQRATTILHRWTWRNTPNSKNIVVLGGSFAGIELVNQLSHTLPRGYRVILIEKNSHLNYVFNFPRFSVMSGLERTAFIPYDGLAKGAPSGIFERIQDTAVDLTSKKIRLASGKEIDYSYLAIATGSSQPLPVNLMSIDRNGACGELQQVQETIKESQKIAIVGGGAVGVELASDIKDFYPSKDVTLVHSRGQLLNKFGERLQRYAKVVLRNELKVRVLLNERPKKPSGGSMARGAILTFSDTRSEQFDLVISCTGQQPNSAILSTLYPEAVSESNSRVIVRPTLQILTTKDPNRAIPIFAFGDVADHGGPQMARAGWLQAGVVANNILALIHGRTPSRTYKPNVFIEGAIKLTLGTTHTVMYGMDEDGSDVMFPSRNGPLDLEIGRAWKTFGADYEKEFGA
ncbi:FAD/NAD(P)-binding domain-containing protein [Ophiobolus disseminans]|uniref:FAD/NAD(P)-binding domain-containing protein n=1 Tax=Ophiobolus disseminans TaxID=1469910 RepID=A0A6A7A029_9PLEO|nr:FAD/NAD(P)-binding domain-containing protein [Ophiobolus disseminans]